MHARENKQQSKNTKQVYSGNTYNFIELRATMCMRFISKFARKSRMPCNESFVWDKSSYISIPNKLSADSSQLMALGRFPRVVNWGMPFSDKVSHIQAS